MATPSGAVPSIGEDGVVSEGRPLQLHNLPTEIGIRRQPVNYTCLDASQQFLVVGSAQGYVWVLELHSLRLLREYSEFKGYSITVVTLNPHRDYLAYGTSHGFIKVERISKIMSNSKFRVQEKSGLSVMSLVWGPNGDDIFCGFTSGRLVRFSVKFSDKTMHHVPLYPEQYGSDIVQLSILKTSLVVSTLERAFGLDTETNKLSQIGRKERKSGKYGGCHLHNDGSLLVSRPGMRLWQADLDGNVQSTLAFKEILGNSHLPAVSVSSVTTNPAQYSRGWQFTTLHPWLEGRFVVTFCEETIFVLDVLNGNLVGVSTFQDPIRAVATAGGAIYVLLSTSVTSKSILRVSIHYSYMPVEMTLKKPLPISTSNSSTPFGSMENLLKDGEGKSDTKEQKERVVDEVSSKPAIDMPSSELKQGDSGTSLPDERDTNNSSTLLPKKDDTDGGSAPVEPITETITVRSDAGRHADSSFGDSPRGNIQADDFPSDGCHGNIHPVSIRVDSSRVSGSQADGVRGDDQASAGNPPGDSQAEGAPNCTHTSNLDTSPVSDSQAAIPRICVTTSASPEPRILHDGNIDDGIVVLEGEGPHPRFEKPKSGSGTDESLTGSPKAAREVDTPSKANSSDVSPSSEPGPASTAEQDAAHSSKSVVATKKVPVSDNETSRRQRMALASNDDDIVADKSKRKKRKTKGKKLSSATSSRSVSTERLIDITEEILAARELEGLDVQVPSDKDYQTCSSKDPSTSDLMLASKDPTERDDSDLAEPGPSVSAEGVSTIIDNKSGQTFSTDGLESESQSISAPLTDEEKVFTSIESRTTVILNEKDAEKNVEDRSIPVLDLMEENDKKEVEGLDKEEMDESDLWTMQKHYTRKEEEQGRNEMEKFENKEEENLEDLFVVERKTDKLVSEEETRKYEISKEEPKANIATSSFEGKLGSGKYTISPLEDVTDNPLYQDTDEELTSDISEERSVSTDYSSKDDDKHMLSGQLVVNQHPLLQPVTSDPLQDEEENLQTGTAAHRRPRWLSKTTGAKLRQPRSRSKHLVPDRNTITSWIEVSKKETYFPKDQQPLFEASDSSHESEQEVQEVRAGATAVDMSESLVVDDFYQLCGDLVDKPGPMSLQQPESRSPLEESGGPMSLPARLLCECDEPEVVTSLNKNAEEETWNSWFSVRTPGLALRCICLSDQLLWVVTSRGKVYYTRATSSGRHWEGIKKPMQQVATSPSGRIIWGTYHQNAYVRLGIGMNPAGSTWKNITKTTSLAHKIKFLAVDESGVWAISVDGFVLFRREVSETCPEGKVWKEIGDGQTNFVSLSCCNGIVWAISANNKQFFREGINPSSPSGTKWCELKTTKMAAVSLTSDGTAWGITEEGAVGFRTGVSHSKPGGRGPWWEVTVERQSHASSPINSLLQVINADGHRISVASLVSLPMHHQSTIISASARGGVVILESGNKLYWSKNMITGYHYTPACKDEMFRLYTWSRVAIGRTATWFVRNDGSLHCLTPEGVMKPIEVPATAELIAASYNCLWVISKDMVWSRQGMSSEVPEGLSFDYIELSTLLHNTKLQSVSCGRKVAWAVDICGVPHFRFGVHAREPGTGMSPAWVPVEDRPAALLNVTVCGDDWLVWACDQNHNVYAREGVTVDFPVGRRWRSIPKLKMKELAATSDRMYGLTSEGELYCRQGITEKNVIGTFWRKLPGNYEHIATGNFGELYTLDSRGQVWKQEWRVVKISTEPTGEFPENDWEVI